MCQLPNMTKRDLEPTLDKRKAQAKKPSDETLEFLVLLCTVPKLRTSK
jgi:hypothetical protein